MLEASKLSPEIKDLFKDFESINSQLGVAEKKEDLSEVLSLRKKQGMISEKVDALPDLQQRFAARVVDEQVVAEVVALWTGIPVTKITEEESEKLLKMEKDLGSRIIGQEDAVKAVVRAVKRSKSD